MTIEQENLIRWMIWDEQRYQESVEAKMSDGKPVTPCYHHSLGIVTGLKMALSVIGKDPMNKAEANTE